MRVTNGLWILVVFGFGFGFVYLASDVLAVLSDTWLAGTTHSGTAMALAHMVASTTHSGTWPCIWCV